MLARAFLALLLATSIHAAQVAMSDFSGGLDGWRTTNSSSLVPESGYIRSTDQPGEADVTFFFAPSKFLPSAQYPTMYGGDLSFDLGFLQGSAGGPWITGYTDLTFSGPQGSIVYDLGIAPGNSGFLPLPHFDISLTEGNWYFYSSPGDGILQGYTNYNVDGENYYTVMSIATQAQMQAVLSSYVSLKIRGEAYNGSGDMGLLDNVVLNSSNSAPEPASWALPAGALVAFAYRFRRR